MDGKLSFVEHFTHANRTARKKNMALQKADWQAYLSRWQDTYCIPDKDWQYLDYSDKTFTASLFPLSSRITAFTNLKMKNLWTTYIKPIIRRLKGTTHG
jgi:hypothetical protein